VTIKIPDGVDWFAWRVLTSPKMTVSLHEMSEFWSFEDLFHANDLLDVLEEAETRKR
jgi:hypothetical protein